MIEIYYNNRALNKNVTYNIFDIINIIYSTYLILIE